MCIRDRLVTAKEFGLGEVTVLGRGLGGGYAELRVWDWQLKLAEGVEAEGRKARLLVILIVFCSLVWVL